MKINLTLDLPESKLFELLSMCSPAFAVALRQGAPVSEKPDVNGDALAPRIEPPVAVPQSNPSAPQAEPAAPTVTKDDVFAMALKCSKAGKQKELAAAFKKFGAKKLSEIAADDYSALMKALSEIGG